ncbi:MAG: nuclear transport factor 2 family protein [Rhodoferax sp.]
MTKARLQAATVGGSANDIEAAFYEALQAADIDRLMACWADEDDIVCIHPGGPRLIGSAAIRASFDAIFANGSIRARPQYVRSVETIASAVHSLVERIEVMTPEGPGEAHVIATNVYQHFAQGWRLVAHHASPGTAHEMLEESPTPQVLH